MIQLTDYGFSDFFRAQIENEEYRPARITAVHKERYEIACEYGISFARLKTAVYLNHGSEMFPTTGDFVLIKYNDTGDSTIVRTLKRLAFFSRRDPTRGRGEQAVAANFDYVFIMQSLNYDFNIKRLERYMTLAWQSGAQPVIVLTKADLMSDCREHIQAVQTLAPGVAVVSVSAISGYGLDALSLYLQPGKTAVFLGSSGVGKSSLVNALAKEEIMGVNEIREDDSRGRHTTTHRQLILLPNNAMIIDTPGMRELGMWDVSAGLGEAFADVEECLGSCRFSDCRHETEPGCAIRSAIQSGALSEERWQSYSRLKREAKYSDDRPAALREKQQLHKKISKWSKQRRKTEEDM